MAIIVTTLVDENNGVSNGSVSLREAIATAAPDETIAFSAQLTQAGPVKIVLTNGQLSITKNLTIDGPGAGLLAIDASGNDATPNVNDGNGTRVFNVDDGNPFIASEVTIRGLTITGGDVTGNGGGILSRERLTLQGSIVADNAAQYNVSATGRGGGIYSSPPSPFSGQALLVEDSTIRANSVLGTFATGGGLYIDGSTGVTNELRDSVLTGNQSPREGGGLSSYIRNAGAKLTITGCTFDNNRSGRGGGAYLFVRNGGVIRVENSTFTENDADTWSGWGGGLSAISVFGDLLISNSTISGNQTTRDGGGIEVSIDGGSRVRIEHTTITGNKSNSLAAGVNDSGGGGGRFLGADVSNSIIAGNFDGSGKAPDLSNPTFGFPSTFGLKNSLIGDRTGVDLVEAPLGSPDANGNLIGGPVNGVIDPLLGPLANNGGATWTHALMVGSPAIDNGDPLAVAGVDGVPEFDQRGEPWSRVVGGRIDMGAIEAQANPLPGDYNFNGVVDAADYTVWRDTMGSENDLRADGSGAVAGVPDGVVDQLDYEFWKANFGSVLAAGQGAGSAELGVSVVSDSASQPLALPGVNVGAAVWSDTVANVEADRDEWIGAFALAERALVRPPAEPGAGGQLMEQRVHGARAEGVLAWVTLHDNGIGDRNDIDMSSMATEEIGNDSVVADCIFNLIGGGMGEVGL